jgi:hypothetical protein
MGFLLTTIALLIIVTDRPMSNLFSLQNRSYRSTIAIGVGSNSDFENMSLPVIQLRLSPLYTRSRYFIPIRAMDHQWLGIVSVVMVPSGLHSDGTLVIVLPPKAHVFSDPIWDGPAAPTAKSANQAATWSIRSLPHGTQLRLHLDGRFLTPNAVGEKQGALMVLPIVFNAESNTQRLGWGRIRASFPIYLTPSDYATSDTNPFGTFITMNSFLKRWDSEHHNDKNASDLRTALTFAVQLDHADQNFIETDPTPLNATLSERTWNGSTFLTSTRKLDHPIGIDLVIEDETLRFWIELSRDLLFLALGLLLGNLHGRLPIVWFSPRVKEKKDAPESQTSAIGGTGEIHPPTAGVEPTSTGSHRRAKLFSSLAGLVVGLWILRRRKNRPMRPN